MFRRVFSGLFCMTIAAAAAGAASAEPLTWAPPTLEKPATIEASNRRNNIKLGEGQDYIIRIVEKITATGGLIIDARGARHIVIIGGEIDIPHQGAYDQPNQRPGKPLGDTRRALYVKNWSGTLHIEGLWIHGEDLGEGINLFTEHPNTVAQIQNVRVDHVNARPEEFAVNFKGVHHPDVMQTWGGPTFLRIDRLTGSSVYQGLFIAPLDHGDAIEVADLRRINLAGVGPEGGRYLVWRKGGPEAVREMRYQDLWVQPGPERIARGIPVVWPKLDVEPLWKDVHVGTPPGGDFVPEGTVGMNYQSPGYVAAAESQAATAE